MLTHTHGLNEKEGITYREYPPRENWTYRNIGIKTLTDIVERTTGKTVSDILHEQVFKPLRFANPIGIRKNMKNLQKLFLDMTRIEIGKSVIVRKAIQ